MRQLRWRATQALQLRWRCLQGFRLLPQRFPFLLRQPDRHGQAQVLRLVVRFVQLVHIERRDRNRLVRHLKGRKLKYFTSKGSHHRWFPFVVSPTPLQEGPGPATRNSRASPITPSHHNQPSSVLIPTSRSRAVGSNPSALPEDYAEDLYKLGSHLATGR